MASRSEPAELGRRAALLHLKHAEASSTGAASSGSLSASTGARPATGGASAAASFGARPAAPAVTAAPQARPGVMPPAPAPPPAPLRPAPPAPPPATAPIPAPGGGISSMFGGMMTPQNIGQMLSGPLKPVTEQALGMGGLPLLAAGSNMLLGGGRDIGNIMKGPIS